MTDDHSAWMCHICDYSSTTEEAIACASCYKIACRKHLRTSSIYNQQTGLYEIARVCALCQLDKLS